ncbi:helix-turn-helix domain-containing protein [Gracilibacillus caseinilyticus]|uniref:Helix-turn-helix domain-containing protein n=1 Tax=Gracilibacillus caseinilyticus TaxID=2932256 RepID=A0ABY4F053_9BACI|nr:helix-turn-helix transcriptional regulator [Gracilibacillus caseinilyticus]UOQ49488.1 helix-turn-helix domain-containing protein [Gracilibacillus caseinilyticus]
MATNKWGKRIKAFRKLKGYTQVSLADELGISVSQLGELERGTKMPTTQKLELIAEHLNVSLEELQPSTKDFEDNKQV